MGAWRRIRSLSPRPTRPSTRRTRTRRTPRSAPTAAPVRHLTLDLYTIVFPFNLRLLCIIGLLTPPNAHIITTTSSGASSQRSAQPSGSTDFWGRRRGFRRSIIDTLTGKWGSGQNSNSNAITNGSGGVQRANTSYSGGIAPNAATANRRASTGTTPSPVK